MPFLVNKNLLESLNRNLMDRIDHLSFNLVYDKEKQKRHLLIAQNLLLDRKALKKTAKYLFKNPKEKNFKEKSYLEYLNFLSSDDLDLLIRTKKQSNSGF